MRDADDHLSFQQLIDMADGHGDPSVQAEAAAHLAACTMCAAELVLAERLIAALMVGDGAYPSAHAMAHVQALFRARRPQQQAMVGALLFDSGSAQPASGFRSAGLLDDRQLLFQAAAMTLDLRLQPAAAQWAISGQVLGPVGQGIVTLADSAVVAQAALSALAEFALPPVAAGSYRLTVMLDDHELVIPELLVGPS